MARSQLAVSGNASEEHSHWSEVWARRWLNGAFVCIVLGASSAVSAAVLTVGVHGTYSTIQAAKVAALGAGTTEIRVEQGTYVEHVYITSSYVSDQIEITGGWDSTFAVRSADASLTVIDGTGVANPVISITMAGGTLLVDGFTITNGSAPYGGGVQADPTGGWITVSNNRIIGNTASSSGAGVYFRETVGSVRFSLIDNLISGNTLEYTGNIGASGGGVSLSAGGGSAFEATGNRIINNTCHAPSGTVSGCGASLGVSSGDPSQFSDNLIKGNRTVTDAGTEVQGAGGYISTANAAGLFVRRNLWIDNRDMGSPEGYHVRITAHDNTELYVTDSVIAGGPTIGVGAWSYESSIVRFTNLTVFDHADTGFYFNANGYQESLFNTIVFGSSTPTDFNGTTVSTGGNLLGVDPLFVDPATWDCHLRAGSPALDSGDMSPPGGRGQYDADGNPRVLNGVVDIGAYEGVATIFEDGFESGLTSAWSVVMP